jgi:hypothetical protein
MKVICISYSHGPWNPYDNQGKRILEMKDDAFCGLYIGN